MSSCKQGRELCLLGLSFASALLRTLHGALGDDVRSTSVMNRVVHLYHKKNQVCVNGEESTILEEINKAIMGPSNATID
jgi:hypothetical protein